MLVSPSKKPRSFYTLVLRSIRDNSVSETFDAMLLTSMELSRELDLSLNLGLCLSARLSLSLNLTLSHVLT